MGQKSTKRVLVTGGAGFLGSHLCERLLGAGHEVLCVDNFYTGHRRNLRHLLDNENFEVLRHDITQPIHLEADVIFNLACAASPVHYQNQPIATLKTSLIGTMHMLDIARRLNIPMFHASTSEVYGDPKVHPQKEDYLGHVNPLGPRACYDEGKRCAETFCMEYIRNYGLDIRIARIFNTYGPRMLAHDGRVVPNFILQALSGDDITLYGEGTQTRSFCYVSDMIDGFIRLMDAPKNIGHPVNLGNPHEITVKELADTIITLTGSKSKLVKKPLPQDDPVRRCPDITVAKTQLHWQPAVRLEDGLKQTIEYYRG